MIRRTTIIALAFAGVVFATTSLRHMPLQFNMLDDLQEYALRLGISVASLQGYGEYGPLAADSSNYFFVRQSQDSNCAQWFAGMLYSTDVCFGTVAFECGNDDDDNDNDNDDDNDNDNDDDNDNDNDDDNDVATSANNNRTGNEPTILYYNPFLSANCSGRADEDSEFDSDFCREFDSGGERAGVFISFDCGVPDIGLLLIPDCTATERNFTVAQIIATDFCFSGQQYSCGNDGSTLLEQFENSDCSGQSRSAEVAGPNECVQGQKFVCLG